MSWPVEPARVAPILMGSLELMTSFQVVLPEKAIIMHTISPLLGAPAHSILSNGTAPAFLSPSADCTMRELLKTAPERPSGLARRPM